MRLTTLLSMALRVVVPKDYRYGTNRPWTQAAKKLNPPGKKRRKVFVEPIAPEDWSVLKGDRVRNQSPSHQHITQFRSWQCPLEGDLPCLLETYLHIVQHGLDQHLGCLTHKLLVSVHE